MKIYTIVPNLLYQSAKTENMNRNQKMNMVLGLGIRLVVNLWHTVDREMAGLVPVYIHQYFPDGKTAIYEPMSKLADHIFKNHIQKDNPTLVHCWGGRNRSGLLNAMLLMRLWGCDGQFAAEYIIKRRPNSLVNKHFVQWLMEQKGYEYK